MDGLVNSRLYGNDGCSSDHLTHFPSSSSSHGIESLWFPDSSPSFPEPSMVNFDGHIQGRGQGGARRSAPAPEKDEEEGDDDDGLLETEGVRNPYRRPGKKRRLAVEQVEQLERSFEEESKLEPERKIHLAKDLGLQPRQVAIWFQNRRARFKTKQLEREYHSLKANFDSLKADFDSLLKDKQTLQNEVSFLTNKLNQNEITDSVDPVHFGRLEAEAEKEAVGAPIYKQEEATSAKSDVVDSESPRCTEGNYTSVLEAVNLKLERSELSPEVEVLRRSFRAGAEYELGDVLEVYGSNLGLPGVEDHSNYWPWLY